MPKTLTPLAAALDAALKECDKPIKEVAHLTGISIKTLYAYRSGGRTPPRDVLDTLVTVMDITEATTARIYSAAGIDLDADSADVAADIIRSLPSDLERRLAVEVLRTMARFHASKRSRERLTLQGRADALMDQAERDGGPPE